MKGSAFKQGGVQGTSGHKSALKQTSPMKGDKKMVDGVEVHPDGHEGHHRVGKAANEEWGKEEGKSPVKQGVDTAKMAQRSREADAGISGRIRRGIDQIGRYFSGPTVYEKEAALEHYNEQVAKLNDAIEQGKMKAKIKQSVPKIVGGMKEKAAEVSEFAKKQKE